MRSRFAPSFTFSLLVLLAACGGGSAPPDPASYFKTPAPYSDPACNAVDGQLTGQREMHLYQSGAVDVLSLTQGLQRYYTRHALTFFTNDPSQDAGTAYALDTDNTALGVALIKQFPGVDFSNEAALMADPVLYDQVLTFAANFILRPMVDFARNHAAGPDVTNFVVVPDLERPGREMLGDPGTMLAGLAISPPLLAEFMRTMPEDGRLWQGVALPDGFTPMMFLGHKVIRAQTVHDPVLRDLVVAHEFGHTGGLPHTTVETNLMFPSERSGRDTCANALTAEQLATMRANLGLMAASTGALTIAPPASAPAARPRFTPAQLRALIAGDRGALRRFLAPFLMDER
jgi:hypothetical protein